jgi:ferredoxin
MTKQLRVNPIDCAGHGLCAELVPEFITLDEWGYPVLPDQPVPARLERQVRRAVTDCPALALVLADVSEAVSGTRGRPGPESKPRSRAYSP